MVDLLTPEGILQEASESVRAELKALTKDKKTMDMQSRQPRDERICQLTVAMCVLEHIAHILLRPEDFND